MHGMKTMASSLPNDPKQLQAIILQLQQTLAQQESVISTLRHQLSVLKRARFGRSSELLDTQIHQLELQLEELEMHKPSTKPKPGNEVAFALISSPLNDLVLTFSGMAVEQTKSTTVLMGS
jgi:hypothetical protein